MTSTRINEIIAAIGSIANVKFARTGMEIDSGEFNNNEIYALPNVSFVTYFRTNPPTQTTPLPLLVVLSQLKDPNNRAQVTKRLAAQKLLALKGVPADFNQTYFYIGSDGTLISQYGNMRDLQELNNSEPNLSLDQVKDLIGQMCLAVRNYHDRDLVHRDISSENFFLNYINNKIYVKLGDQDSIAEVHHDTGATLIPDHLNDMAARYLAPELKRIDTLNVKRQTQNKKLLDYSKIDWKMTDCYSLSICIWGLILHGLNKNDSEKMYEMTEDGTMYKSPTKGSEHDLLANLFYELYRKDPEERCDIIETMNNEYFGKSAQERRDFFNRLVAESNVTVAVDNLCMDYRTLNINNASILLDPSYKNTYMLAQGAAFCMQNFYNSLSHQNHEFSLVKTQVATYLDTHQTISNLILQIEYAKSDNPEPFLIPLLNELSDIMQRERSAITEHMETRGFANVVSMVKASLIESSNQGEVNTLFNTRAADESEFINQMNSLVDYESAVKCILTFCATENDSPLKQLLRLNLSSVAHRLVDPNANEINHAPQRRIER